MKNNMFPLIFGIIFQIISLASGGGQPPEPSRNACFQNFQIFSLNFRKNFVKMLKHFQNILTFPSEFSKNYKTSIDFLKFFATFRV